MYVPLVLALVAFAAAQDMDFAFYKGELYATVHRQYEDRGAHTLYFLHAMRNQAPNVHATLSQLSYDGASPNTTFAFWRSLGARTPRLMPDYDWTGWAAIWVPPHHALVAAQGHTPWARRKESVYWTGATNAKERRAFVACSADHAFEADVSDWGEMRQQPALPFTGAKLKPASADLRRLTRHKFLIYLRGVGWSTSMKRIVSAGAAVFLPAVREHEAHTDTVLASCSDCFLYYDPADICGSVKRVLSNLTDTDAHRMAARLKAFVAERFSEDAVRRYALAQLSELAASHAFPAVRVRGDKLVFLKTGVTLRRQTCREMKRAHRAQIDKHLHWQIDAWLDRKCSVALRLPYLDFVAL